VKELFKRGCILTLDCKYWDGSKLLKPEDMGILEDALPKDIVLGRKYILPRDKAKEFNKIVSVVRQLIYRNSYQFPFGGRYVLHKNIPFLIEKLVEQRKIFEEYKDYYVSAYDELKEEAKPSIIDLATHAVTRSRRGHQVAGKLINEFIDRIESLYPTLEELKEKYVFSYTMHEVSLPLVPGLPDDIVKEIDTNTQKTLREFSDQIAVGYLVETGHKLMAFREFLQTQDVGATGKKGGRRMNSKIIDNICISLDYFDKLNVFATCPIVNETRKLSEYIQSFDTHKVFALNKDIIKHTSNEAARIAALCLDQVEVEKRKDLIWRSFF